MKFAPLDAFPCSADPSVRMNLMPQQLLVRHGCKHP